MAQLQSIKLRLQIIHEIGHRWSTKCFSNGLCPASLCLLFILNFITILQQKNGKNHKYFSNGHHQPLVFIFCLFLHQPSSMWSWDLNSKPLDNRSPSITTRPGLLLLPTCKCSSSSKFFLESDLLKAYLLNMIVSVTRCQMKIAQFSPKSYPMLVKAVFA